MMERLSKRPDGVVTTMQAAEALLKWIILPWGVHLEQPD